MDNYLMDSAALSNFFEEISFWNLLFLCLAIVSLLFAYKSNKKSKPLYLVKNLNLFRDEIGIAHALEINFFNKKINNLSVAHVFIWNGGNEVINKQDIANKDPLRIYARKGVELLDAEIIFEQNTVNQFKKSVIGKGDKRVVEIDFDYFSSNEGIIVRVFHTGKTKTDIFVKGTIKNTGRFNNMNNSFTETFMRSMERIKLRENHKRLFFGVSSFFMPFIPLLILMIFSVNNVKGVLITSIILLIIYWPTSYILLKDRIPKNFVSFEEF